ncbi:YwmB family TATA-box binding protein [Alkaliphilus serpentinus]|uniref:TATA-box binding n=1 Tax=Alkaliphilus serpentinus TaxID=1482731 RepID=A0A833HLU0_9FIRM|nr:YwmB family TATA-box binding protein [Alkaliphilus serpentinus]KAB3526671.1 hypothetical protein F8153_13800 [Alkaliphilus serpentinus]
MKKLLLILLFIISLALIRPSVAIFQDDAPFNEDEMKILSAFEKSGAQLAEVSTYKSLQLDNQYIEIEEMEVIIDDLISQLNLKGEVIHYDNTEYYDPYFSDETLDFDGDTILIRRNEEDGYNQITVTALEEIGSITTIIVYSFNSSEIKESYIIIDIVKNKGYKDIVELNKKSIKALEPYGNDIEGTIAMVGFYPHKKTEEETKGIIKDISLVLKASVIEEVQDEAYNSITLYSPFLTNTIEYQNKKVNLQLATRYNSYEDRTYIWIASPLISNTY